MWKLAVLLQGLALISGSVAVRIDVDYTAAADLEAFAARTKATLQSWYPYLAEYLRSPTYEEIDVIPIYFDPNYDGVAYAAGGRIVGSVFYYRGHQDDIGSMIHEMAHVIQGYRNGPGWLVEGIADYVRNYHFEQTELPKPRPGSNYTDAYKTAAYFLNWIKKTYFDEIIYYANKDCREGVFEDTFWQRLTGKTVDQLWAEMMETA